MPKPIKKHLSLWCKFNENFDAIHSRPRARGKFKVANFIKDAFRRMDAIQGIYTCIESCMLAFWMELYNRDNAKHPFNVDPRSYRLYPNSYNLRYDGLQAMIIILRLIAKAKLNANPIHPLLLDPNYMPICIPYKERQLGYEIIIGVVRKFPSKANDLDDIKETRGAQGDDFVYCLGRSEPIPYATMFDLFNNVPEAFNPSLRFLNPPSLDVLQEYLQVYMSMNNTAVYSRPVQTLLDEQSSEESALVRFSILKANKPGDNEDSFYSIYVSPMNFR